MKKFSLLILSVSIILSILLTIYLFNKETLGLDGIGHYQMMRADYDNKTLPTLGAYLQTSPVGSSNVARVPGGYFILEYMIHFFIGGGTLPGAMISYTIAMMIAAGLFLFWVFN